MEQISDHMPSVSHTLPLPYKDDLKVATEKIKKHGPLLHTIAKSFGFSNSEASEIVQEICLQAYKYYTNQEIRFPLRVWLVKNLIHKCTFKISQAFFSQQQREPASIRWICLNFHSAPGTSRLQEMPLSLKAVYLLTDQFYFNEIEVAEILNISTFKVKERLQKAQDFLTNHQ